MGDCGACWADKLLPESWLETQTVPSSTFPDEVPSVLVVRALNGSLRKLLLGFCQKTPPSYVCLAVDVGNRYC